MPDQYSPSSVIQNSLSAGEISPALYGRTDLQKYHSGVALMRNFFVDYRGGASNRPGTQYMGQATSTGKVRLIPFIFSSAIGQTYILVFSNLKLNFIKNPGGVNYPNGSNAGFIQLSGSQYTINTPYLAADLPFLKFSQVGDVMRITRHGYPRMELSRFSDTNWTLTAIGPPTLPGIPSGSPSVTISGLPAGSSDPQNTRYLYAITSVDANGNESQPSFALSPAGIDIAITQGTVTVFFGQGTNAVFYKVYKALPTPGAKLPSVSGEFGFAGFAYGTTFVDSNIVPDFGHQPPFYQDPFASAQIIGYTISNPGTGYPNSGVTLSVSDPNGTGAVIFPVMGDNTAAGTSGIVGIYIAQGGAGYTAPTIVITGGGGGSGFVGTLQVGPNSGLDPDVVGLFQQRCVYASTLNRPTAIFLSKPNALDDFRTTNPVVDSDGFEFDIATPQIDDILWVRSMPGGLLVGTSGGILQLTGGSSSPANPIAVTPSSAVIVPQSYYGTADLHPIVINYNVLYVQAEGAIVRDLQYNFFVNIYLGQDITFLSSHLFYPHTVVAWDYQDTPNKIVWAIREDGLLLSLTYLKEQEITSWAQHTTNGTFEDIAVVREGALDAVYFVVNRNGTRFIERMCDRVLVDGVIDSWFLDAALSTPPGSGPVSSISGISHLNGYTVTAIINGVPYPNLGPIVGGTLTLPATGDHVVVGLPYTCDIQDLYFDVGGEMTLQGRRKKISAWSLRVKDSVGFKMGTTSSDLRLWTQGRDSTDPQILPSTPGLMTGDARAITQPWFNVGGQIWIRQDQPLPLTVLSIIKEVAQGDTK